MQAPMAGEAARYRKLLVRLGEGSYKTVTKAIDEEEGKEVAYNEVQIKRFEEETQSASSFSKEVALLKNIDHPYIIRIFDYWFEEDVFVFVTELMTGGTLRDYITKAGPLNGKLIKKWGRQILEGLRYLHTCEPPIIHRDIKNENIFVNASQGDIKIGDLGISRERRHKRYTIVGTPSFMAREMFEGEGYSEKVDIYAFGMSLLEMATGVPPYAELSDTGEICQSVLRGVLPRCLGLVEDGCLRSLIMACLVPQNDRYSADQCLEHHFFAAESGCAGDCIPAHCVTVYPLSSSAHGLELSLVSYNDPVITFQILLASSLEFIKFDYNLAEDTLGKVANELMREKIIDAELIGPLMELLDGGIKKVLQKSADGQIHGGLVELDTSESAADAAALCEVPTECRVELSSTRKFGEKTLEVMSEIEQEMFLLEQKKVLEKRRTAELKHGVGVLAKQLEGVRVAPRAIACEPLPVTGEFASEQSCLAVADASCVDALQISTDAAVREQSAEPAGSPPKDDAQAEDLSLSESFDLCKNKYQTNCSIAQFATDAALITRRSEDTTKAWIKSLRDEDIASVFDLKLIVYEDWEKLPLTVFSARTMQNMLYGLDNIPLKEKQLPLNPAMPEFENGKSIADLLADVCARIGRPEAASSWENKLMAQDIRTVGELRSLHQDDWNRLGLSVFAYRILKNVIFKKGRLSFEAS
ncbi:WNK lysine deficient protein kinase [Pancytospora philotis]|nr:WNK lysine deficient protein kinase [Pancytospora philotis]